MAVSPEYKTFVEDLFTPLGPVKVRSMFGGAGIFAPLEEGDVMFGLIARQTVYLKVDDENRLDFEQEGMEPFSFEGGDKTVTMSYYQLPERLYDDPEELAAWGRRALAAARRAKAAQPKKKRARKRGRRVH